MYVCMCVCVRAHAHNPSAYTACALETKKWGMDESGTHIHQGEKRKVPSGTLQGSLPCIFRESIKGALNLSLSGSLNTENT